MKRYFRNKWKVGIDPAFTKYVKSFFDNEDELAGLQEELDISSKNNYTNIWIDRYKFIVIDSFGALCITHSGQKVSVKLGANPRRFYKLERDVRNKFDEIEEDEYLLEVIE